jgi:predicted transposase/invertase (TIGR01784 family)
MHKGKIMIREIDNIEIPELLPFKNDYIFKSALTKPNAGIVRNSMLSAFTGLDIVESTVSENEPPIVLNRLERPVRLDVNCKTADGKQINIEMQTQSMEGDNFTNQHINLCNRSVYYASKLFVSQDNPKIYENLKQTFQITLCDFCMFKGEDEDEKFIHRFSFSDGKLQLTDVVKVIFLELPKIKNLLNKPVNELNAEAQWAMFIEIFGNKDFYNKLSEFENKEEFKMANTILSNISKNDEERYNYISRLKYQMDLTHNIEVAKLEGKAEGMIQKAIATAKNLLRMGLTPEQVAQGTELPIEEIKKISLT